MYARKPETYSDQWPAKILIQTQDCMGKTIICIYDRMYKLMGKNERDVRLRMASLCEAGIME